MSYFQKFSLLKVRNQMKKVFIDTRGDTNIVAIILIIVIIIGLVIIFRDRIQSVINSVFDNIDNKVDGV